MERITMHDTLVVVAKKEMVIEKFHPVMLYNWNENAILH